MSNASVANAESRGSGLPTINMRQAKRGNFGVHHLNRGKPKGRRRPVEMPCDVLRNTALPPSGRISYSFLTCDDYRLGNQLPLIYMMWLLAGSAGVPLKWRCMSSHTGTILHSLYELHKSSFERPRPVNATTSTLRTICNTCTSDYPHTCGGQSFEQAADWIRDDLQQVTTAMAWITSLSQRWKSLEVYDSPLLNPHTGNDDESPPPLSDWDMQDILGWLREN